jgi:hypothetical protein
MCESATFVKTAHKLGVYLFAWVMCKSAKFVKIALFSPKYLAKQLAFLTQNEAKLCKKLS